MIIDKNINPEYLEGDISITDNGLEFNGGAVLLPHAPFNNANNWRFYAEFNGEGLLYSEGTPDITFRIYAKNGEIIIYTWNKNTPGYWKRVSTGKIFSEGWNKIQIDYKDGMYYIYKDGSFVKKIPAPQKEYHPNTKFSAIGDNIGAYHGGKQGHEYFIGTIKTIGINEIPPSNEYNSTNSTSILLGIIIILSLVAIGYYAYKKGYFGKILGNQTNPQTSQ